MRRTTTPEQRAIFSGGPVDEAAPGSSCWSVSDAIGKASTRRHFGLGRRRLCDATGLKTSCGCTEAHTGRFASHGGSRE